MGDLYPIAHTPTMKPILYPILLFLALSPSWLAGQTPDRLKDLKNQLDSLSRQVPGLAEKSRISLQDVSLADYIRTLGQSHAVNVYIEDTPAIRVSSDWQNESVQNILLFLCRQFDYTFEVSGSIIAFRPYHPLPRPSPKPPEVNIRLENGLLSADLHNDSLHRVLRKLSQLSGKKLLTRPGTTGLLSAYLPPTPLDTAIEALLLANGFSLQVRPQGYCLVQALFASPEQPALTHTGRLDFTLEAFLEHGLPLLNVKAEEADLYALLVAIFEATEQDYLLFDRPAGSISLDAEMLPLSLLLQHLLQGTDYGHRHEDGLWLIGQKDRPGLQTTEIVHLRYRPTFQALELIPGLENLHASGIRQAMQPNPEAPRFPQNQSSFSHSATGSPSTFDQPPSFEAPVSRPPEIFRTRLGEVELVEYPELNRIILKGPGAEVAELREFLQQIDQIVPMVRVDMLVVEVNEDRLLNSSLQAGLQASADSGLLPSRFLPGLQQELNSQIINALLGQIPALSSLGPLHPDFYLRLKAEEARGNLKITMQPVLSMLNGRRASLVIGQTQYYLLETQTAANGAVNNFSQFSQRFERIEANIQLSIRPYISEDSSVTLEVQPNFTTPVGNFDAQVPPTIATRRFDATIRVRDGETVILGGLTEERQNESTRGLPLLSRIPVLKWLFGNVEKGKSRQSLLIYLTPTIIYQ
jgi:type IV pilus assembly protein PilQ